MSASGKTQIDMASFIDIAPGVRDALLAMGKAVAQSGLEADLIELAKVRASQINGCAYCTQLHVNIARRNAMPAAKLDLVAVWREADIFSARERAALAWAEALTDLAHRSVDAAVHADVAAQFSETELVFLTAAIANINAWNRIAGPLHFTPPEPTP